jgi:DNA-binding NarL/FixJ family response regulator
MVAQDEPDPTPEVEDEPRILVVEDDAAVRNVYTRTLGRAGFRTRAVASIAAAKGHLHDATEQFEAAVLDFELPDGTAFDLVGDLLKREPLCKSLVITGVAGPTEAQRFVQAGAHAFIAKPVQPQALVGGVINTVYATLQWRRHTEQLPGPPGVRKAVDLSNVGTASPLDLDPASMLARLRRIGGLSPTQTMVAFRLLWGDNDREIAAFLHCAERTAKRHVSAVLRRTAARGRAGLVGVLFRDCGYDDDRSVDRPMPEPTT